MMIVKLGEDVNIEQFMKFALLCKRVIEKYDLLEYANHIHYELPKNRASQLTNTGLISYNFRGISISSLILDYKKFKTDPKNSYMTTVKGVSKNYAVNNIHDIYSKMSFKAFKYNLTQEDMIILNRINKAINQLK